MPRARIFFKPNGNVMENVDIIDKHSGYGSTDDVVSDGYVTSAFFQTASELNSTAFLRLKAKEGYKIQSAHKTNSGGTSNTGNFTVESDGSVLIYPWVNGTLSILNNYLYLDVVEDVVETYPITLNLVNCTANIGDELEAGTHTVILDADEGFYFAVNGTYIDGTALTRSIHIDSNDNTKTVPIDFLVEPSFTSHVITMSAVPIPAPKIPIEMNLVNCTANIDDELEEGTYSVTLTANDGYEFSGFGTYRDGFAITHTITPNHEDKTVTIPFDFYVNPNYSGHLIEMVASEIVEQLSTFVNLYKVTNDILSQLSQVRFFVDPVNGLIDYGSYITNLTEIDFSLPNELISGDKNIILGNYDSTIPAPQLNQYVYEMNLGVIQVPKKYDNVYDYLTTTCYLHVPYMDRIELPSESIIGYDVSIIYFIDLYSLEFTLNVYSTFTNNIISSHNGKMGIDIPFIQKQSNAVINQLSPNIKNNIRKPFIEVIRNIPYDVHTDYGKEVLDFDVLNNFNGYIEVENVTLNVNATSQEKNKIVNLLRNGVVIK